MSETKEKKVLKTNGEATAEEQERLQNQDDPIAALSLLDNVVAKISLNRQDTITTIRAVKVIEAALKK